MNMNIKNPLGLFRVLAFLEGCSFILIGLTMILKYQYGMPGPNYVVGMAHGFLFIAYVLFLIFVAYRYSWTLKHTVLGLAASLIPFGTFYADKKVFSKYSAN